MTSNTALTRLTVTADPKTQFSPADRLLHTLQTSLAGQFEIFGELGRGDAGRIVYLARELASTRLVALQLTPTGSRTVGGEDYWFEVVRTLDAGVPALDSNCPKCGKSLGGWGRFCRHCGVDLGGIAPTGKPGSADELLRDVRAVARGRYDVLGQMDRTEGGGTVYFARELASGKLVALRLQREGDGVHGTERYSLGLTGVLRPAVAAALGVAAPAGAPGKITLAPTPAQAAATVVAPPPKPPAAPASVAPPHVPQITPPEQPTPPAAPETTARDTWQPTREQSIAIAAGIVTLLALGVFAATRRGSNDVVIGDPTIVDTTQPITSTILAADSGEVQVGVRLPAGARVRVDGAPVAGRALRIPAGTHTLTLTAPGYREATQEVTLAAGQTLVWTPQLMRVSAATGSVASPDNRPSTRPTPPRTTPRSAAPTTRTPPPATPALDTSPPVSVSAMRADSTRGTLTDISAISCGSLFARLEWSRALTACEEEAKRGSVVAQRTVGTIFEQGLGVSRNPRNAAQWYVKAADAGDAVAQFRLGEMLATGAGVRKDEAGAVNWFRRASEQQHLEATYALAQALERGQGVKRNQSEALSLFNRAAEAGSARAQTKLGSLFAAGDIVARDDKTAVAWFRKAADQQYPEAQYRLGDMYARGLGVARSSAEAERWFKLAAAQGHERARKALR